MSVKGKIKRLNKEIVNKNEEIVNLEKELKYAGEDYERIKNQLEEMKNIINFGKLMIVEKCGFNAGAMIEARSIDMMNNLEIKCFENKEGPIKTYEYRIREKVKEYKYEIL